MPSRDSEPAASWSSLARSLARPLAGEVVGTALLVLLGVASLLPVRSPAPLTHPALGFGFLVTALVQVFGPISGAHLNPAVTAAALVAGRIKPAPAAAYVLAQLAGGAAGFGALVALLPRTAFAELDAAGSVVAVHGPAAPAPTVGAPCAAVVEALLTGVLALVACALWAAHDPQQPDHSAPVKFGLTVAGLVYAGGPISGASLNPARSFGPALWFVEWTDHWVYWLGPVGGAVAAAALHRWVLAPASAAPAPRRDSREQMPLNDKHDRV